MSRTQLLSAANRVHVGEYFLLIKHYICRCQVPQKDSGPYLPSLQPGDRTAEWRTLKTWILLDSSDWRCPALAKGHLAPNPQSESMQQPVSGTIGIDMYPLCGFRNVPRSRARCRTHCARSQNLTPVQQSTPAPPPRWLLAAVDVSNQKALNAAAVLGAKGLLSVQWIKAWPSVGEGLVASRTCRACP